MRAEAPLIPAIYDVLAADHREIAAAIDAALEVQDRGRRRDLLSFIRTQLAVHSKAEEEVFYRPLRDRMGSEVMVRSAIEEHQEIEHLLMKLQTHSADTLEWTLALQRLKSVIELHVAKEEGEMFALGREHFDDVEATAIAVRMMEEKGKLGMENPVAVLGKKLKQLVA